MLPKFSDTTRQNLSVGAFLLGLTLAALATGILASHTRLFSQKRDTAVMVGTELPELKSSVALLRASVEAERYFAAEAGTAREEQASVFILPDNSPVSRTVSAMQELAAAIGTDGGLALDKLTFDAKPVDSGSVKSLAGHAVLRGSYQGVGKLLAVLGFSGDMMVRDVLSVEVQEAFLRHVEAASPASLKAAEDFLYLDLVQYASDPDSFEQRMLRDVSVDAAADIRAILLEGGLMQTRSALGGVAQSLKKGEAWPLPLLSVTRLSRAGDAWTLDFNVFSR